MQKKRKQGTIGTSCLSQVAHSTEWNNDPYSEGKREEDAERVLQM